MSVLEGIMKLSAYIVIGLFSLVGTSVSQAGFSGALSDIAAASSQEKIAYANSASAEMSVSLKKITRMTADAERAQNDEKLQCLHTRLASVTAVQSVAELAVVSMVDAISEGEDSVADREFLKVVVALNNTRQLTSEAESCGYESLIRSGETSVIVEGGVFEEDNDTQPAEFDIDVGFDPPEASPFY
jgi:hypothetical protein